jgi:APA family basic amino acid/polyamine antiporter
LAERPARSGIEDGDLGRHLGLADAVALYVGIILGSGIFIAPASVAAATGDPAMAAGIWLLAGGVAACGALCYAENAVRIPRSGGFYVFYREALGEAVAFVGGWAGLLVTYPASIAAIALVFASYLGRVVPLPVPEAAAAAGGILLSVLLNGAGLRAGPLSQRLLSAAKVAAVGLLVLASVSARRGPGPGFEAESGTEAGVVPLAAFLAALIVVLWTYDGWSDVTLVAGEIRDPRRNLGRAVVLGSAILVALYGGVQLAVLAVLGRGRAAASEEVFSEAVRAALGEGMGRFVAALIVVSTLGSVHGIVLTSSRLAFAMARDGVFFRVFGSVHPTLRTPIFSLVWVGGLSCLYVFGQTFRQLLGLFSFSVWIFYALGAVSLVLLRRRGVGGPRAWVAPGGWIAPGVVWATAALVTSWLVRDDPWRCLAGLALLLLGFPVYYGWRRSKA